MSHSLEFLIVTQIQPVPAVPDEPYANTYHGNMVSIKTFNYLKFIFKIFSIFLN